VREGARRHTLARERGYRPRGGMEVDPTADVIGIIGEFAVCKALGRTFSPAKPFEPDFPDGLEVRAAADDDRGRGLLVRPNDDPTGRYVLALVHPTTGQCRIPGWAYGTEVKQFGRPRGNPPHHYWTLPPEGLRPLDTLPSYPRIT
jgi:hypothetical protein